MTTFISLISSSSGNSTLISDGKTTIVTDCGMSGKAFEKALSSIGFLPNDVDAILITHEHSDHTKGVGIISKRYNIPVFATSGTLSSPFALSINDDKKNIIKPLSEFSIGDIGVLPFSISHDAVSPVGYKFYVGDKKLAIATDSGIITSEMEHSLIGCDEIILESNHDKDMLMYGDYPFYLKQRILSDTGHLSNDAAAEFSKKLLKSGTKKILLAHLSKENNTPEVAYTTTKLALENEGAKIGKDIFLSVANRAEITKF